MVRSVFSSKRVTIAQLLQANFLLFGIFLFPFTHASANKIVIQGRVENNQVKLRWAPLDIKKFIEFAETGYQIKRVCLSNSSIQPVLFNCKPFAKEDHYWINYSNYSASGFLHELLFSEKSFTEISIGLALMKCDQDSLLALAAGIFFSDTSVLPNQEYQYHISAKSDTSYTSTILINTNKKTIDPELEFTLNCRNGQVLLKLEEEKVRHHYCAYMIERSEDSVHFELVNKTPLIQLFNTFDEHKKQLWYSDTVDQNKKYYYRFSGITSFGTLHKSKIISSCFLYPEFNSSLVIASIELSSPEPCVAFNFLDSNDYGLVEYYTLDFSLSFNDPFIPLTIKKIEKNKLYLDQIPDAEFLFLRVGAIHFNRDTLLSWPEQYSVTDSFPPKIPQQLQGQIDSVGKVKLSWKENSEADFKAYKIFRRNDAQEEFVEISTSAITSASFTDSVELITLSTSIEYAVAAYDQRYNTSSLSEVIRLKRPDIVPPIPAQIKSITENNGCVQLIIQPSDSRDVKNVTIIRTPLKNSDSLQVYHYPANVTLHSDTCTKNMILEYKLITTDSSGNFSHSKKIQLSTRIHTERKVDLMAEAHRSIKKIALSWTGQQKNDVIQIFVQKME